MTQADAIRNRLLALVTFMLAVAALRWSYPVTMPLVVTFFIIAAAWPIKPWLEHVLPPRLSTIGTILALFLLIAGFFAIISVAIAQVAQTLARDQDQYRALYEGYVSWARARGLPVLGGDGGYDQIAALASVLFWRVYAMLGYIGFISVLVALGLPEVPALAARLRRQLHAAEHRDLVDTVQAIAEKCRKYIATTMLTSLITGVASALWSLSIGLELALMWGILNFLLNFIPVIGNIAGIIPPTLYAMIQFDGWTMPAVVFAGFAVLQIVISNVVYPLLQGRSMSMPPVAVIIALLFWGWVWGIAGALLAVPLTAALVIVCEHFRSTEWLSRLFVRPE